MPTPSSSSAPTGCSRSCGPIWAASFATSLARSRAMAGLEAAFAQMLMLARLVREQQQRQRGPKVYSLHAPEVECIGKGKAHRPYEFGVKVSVATTISHAKGGQFVTHVKALPG